VASGASGMCWSLEEGREVSICQWTGQEPSNEACWPPHLMQRGGKALEHPTTHFSKAPLGPLWLAHL